MILIGLLQTEFFENLQTEKFPSHMIRSRKQDLLSIQEIVCNYRLNEVNLTVTSVHFSNLEILSKLYFITKNLHILITYIYKF